MDLLRQDLDKLLQNVDFPVADMLLDVMVGHQGDHIIINIFVSLFYVLLLKEDVGYSRVLLVADLHQRLLLRGRELLRGEPFFICRSENNILYIVYIVYTVRPPAGRRRPWPPARSA